MPLKTEQKGEVMKRVIIVIVSLIFCNILFCYSSDKVSIREQRFGTRGTSTKRQTSESKFTPVFIYRVFNDNRSEFAGSGSLFSKGGKGQIVTAEHLFKKQYQINFYVYRPAKDNSGPYHIKCIKDTGYEIARERADVAILETGSAKRIIRGFSEYKTPEFDLEEMDYKDNNKTLTCLVSGRKARIIATAKKKGGYGNGVTYTIIDYESKAGDSGSGFVDENDNIYVLKGSLSDEKQSIVYGPLKF
ncbi:MAG: hypothetical protein WC827_04755 [Candidatus Paceibacterota bacterium]|jgi:hypothetical protein